MNPNLQVSLFGIFAMAVGIVLGATLSHPFFSGGVATGVMLAKTLVEWWLERRKAAK